MKILREVYKENMIFVTCLCKIIKKRLGCGEEDVKEIQRHPFFMSIDWQDLVAKKVSISA